jgi:hypothetical protein
VEALMNKLVMLMAVLALARGAEAQNADDYRGGWRTDKGEAHTYEFSIRGNRVRGIYCTYAPMRRRWHSSTGRSDRAA